ncbi:MAG TPA: alpha/beta hydrolase [Pseudonocardiaceae bacterium]
MAREYEGYECRVAGMAARIGGRGAPVLLMHGIGGCAESFAPQQGKLDGFTTIAWDAPGYGGSVDLPADPSAEPADRYARAAVDLLRGLGHSRAHVVGVSWGGVTATRMALRYPDMMRSLTLVDSSRGSGRTAAGRAGMLRRVEELAEMGADAFARSRGPNLLAPDAPAAVVERVVATMARVRLTGYRGAAVMMAATDHSADLGRIRVPTLVLVGEQDRVTGVPESRALAEGISGARLVVVPGGGHAVHQENPSAFNAELCRFLTEVERERQPA